MHAVHEQRKRAGTRDPPDSGDQHAEQNEKSSQNNSAHVGAREPNGRLLLLEIQLAVQARRLSFSMATEVAIIDIAQLRARVGELRRFL
jgi:hypothetical protein